MKISISWLFFLVGAVAAMGQETPVKWSAASSAAVVKPGEKFSSKLTAQIDPGWHMYSITQGPGGPFTARITVPAGQLFSPAGPVTGPIPQTAFDSNFQMQTETYEHSAEFKVPLTAGAQSTPGANAVSIDVRYQVCNGRLCLPPKTVHLTAPVKIANASPSGKVAGR